MPHWKRALGGWFLVALTWVASTVAAVASSAPGEPPTPALAQPHRLTGSARPQPRAARAPSPFIRIDGMVLGPSDRAARARRPDGTISPLAAGLAPALDRLGLRSGERAAFLVRLNTLQVAGVRAALERLGAQVVTYLPDAALLVRMAPSALTEAAQLPQVEWIDLWQADYKLARARQTPTGREQLATVHLFPGAPAERVEAAWARQGGRIEARSDDPQAPALRGTATASALEALAQLPEVWRIEPYEPPRLYSDVAAGIIGADTVWNDLGLTGEGQIIGHADTGVDVGSSGTLHADFTGRIAAAFALGRPSNWSDPQGHGTHTAGLIVGTGAVSAGRFRGMAPGARLVHQSVMDAAGNLTGLPVDYGLLFQQAYDAGARIHSDSWGADVGGAYAESYYLDRWAWNDGAPKPMLIVTAAGNAGPSTNTLGAPGTAKNALTVGASENYRPFLSTWSDNPDDVAEFSARGPTDDGRIKPDLVAPGTWIVSTRTHGDLTPFSDRFESGMNGWRLEPVSAAWSLTTATYHSPTTAWRYQAAGLKDDFLVTPPVTVPSQGPLYVRFWIEGSFGNQAQVGVAYREPGKTWVFPPSYMNGPITLPPNYLYSWVIPPELYGKTLEFAVNAYGYGPTANWDLAVDDFEISTFVSWDDLWTVGLATPGDPIDLAYTLLGGTSMAAPLVAGGAALARQFFEQRVGVVPSAELLKALLINGATDPTPATPRPDVHSGWGRLDLAATLAPTPPRTFLFDQDSTVTEGTLIEYELLVTDAAEPLRATLVWADPPAATLQNDLDLRLEGPSGPVERPDSVNNVEGIDVDAPAAGLWRVQVIGQRLMSPVQPYAVVISGAVALPQVLAVVSPYGVPSPPTGENMLASGTLVLATAPPIVAESADVRHAVRGWRLQFEDGETSSGLGAEVAFVLDRATTLTWEWQTQYRLTGLSDPIDGGSVIPASAWIDAGTTATLVASPATGWRFVDWVGGPAGSSDNPLMLTMDAPSTRTARFALDAYALFTSAVDGTVERSPDAAVYAHGTTVTLQAVPDPGYHFTGWSGDASGAANPVALVMDTTRTVTAHFARDRGTVVLAVQPGTAGWELIDGDGASRTGTGNAILSAVPAGSITVVWKPLADYDPPTPNPATATLTNDGQTTVAAVYTPHLFPGLLDYLLGKTPYHPVFDVNGDGRVDIADLWLVQPYRMPAGPSPAQGATGVPTTTALDWADAWQATAYDVYLWLDPAPRPAQPTFTGLTQSRVEPPALQPGTVYRWQVIARSADGPTTGPQWTFTTASGQ